MEVAQALLDSVNAADEPGSVVGPNTLPFLHFSISTPTLTYHDARNRCDASRKRAQSRFSLKSLLLATPLISNV